VVVQILIVSICPSAILIFRQLPIPGRQNSAPGYVLGGSLKPTIIRNCSVGPCSRSCIAVMITGLAWDSEEASRKLDRYELAKSAEQRFESLSGGQQARLQILLLELGGATLLILDEPTDNLDLESAEALEQGLDSFEGTVVAVTHDRWFARGFDRYLIFGGDGSVYESVAPVWDETRVERAR
jgi:ABC-type Mn2+/Zn2+ transport system ATPase subunit